MVSARAIRAGRANVELGLDDSQFQRGLRGIGKDLQSVGKNLAVGGAALAGFGTAILAPLGKAVKDFAAIGDQLDKMSLRTGVAVEQLSALRFAAEQSGASLEAVEKGLKGQARFMVDAARGLATQADVLAELNLSYQQLEGLDPATLFKTLAVAIANVDDETAKAGLAMKVFGRAGTDLLPLFKAGENGIAALLAEAEELGIVMSTEDATAAAELTDEMNRLSKTFQQIKLEIGSALAPLLTELSANKIRPLVKDVVDWVKQNSGLVIGLAKFGAALVAIGAPLAGLGFAIQGIGTTLTFVATAAPAAATALMGVTAAMGPLGAAVAAISFAVVIGEVTGLNDKLKEFLGLTDEARKKGQGNAPTHQGKQPSAWDVWSNPWGI